MRGPHLQCIAWLIDLTPSYQTIVCLWYVLWLRQIWPSLAMHKYSLGSGHRLMRLTAMSHLWRHQLAIPWYLLYTYAPESHTVTIAQIWHILLISTILPLHIMKYTPSSHLPSYNPPILNHKYKKQHSHHRASNPPSNTYTIHTSTSSNTALTTKFPSFQFSYQIPRTTHHPYMTQPFQVHKSTSPSVIIIPAQHLYT